MTGKMECGSCRHYTESHYCRLDQKRKRAGQVCPEYRIRLADHYVPNVWEEWKHKAERAYPKKKKG